MLKKSYADLIIGALLFVMSVCLLLVTTKHTPPERHFYQIVFEPAVMLACGHGMGINPRGPSEALSQFLLQKKSSFNCAELGDIPAIQVNNVARSWYYLLAAVAGVWMTTGVSWPAVDYLVALLCGITVIFSYGFFRLGMSTWLAALCALLFLQVLILPEYFIFLRDYSKVPFFMGVFFCLGLWVLRSLSNKFLVASAILLGSLIGIGYGFRPDILITVPPILVTLLFFLPNGFSHWWRNIGLCLLVIASFLIVAWPALEANYLALGVGAQKQGSCRWHIAQLGLATPFTESLGLQDSIYDFGYQYNDSIVYAMAMDYGRRVLHIPSIPYCSQDHDIVARSQYLQIIKTFPADFLLRAYQSTRQLFFEPGRHFNLGQTYLRFYLRLGAFLTIFLILALIGRGRWRLGIFLTLMLGLFFAYPAIQFHGRHYFHLVVWFLWPVGFFINQIFNISIKLFNASFRTQCWNRWMAVSKDSHAVTVLFSRLGIFLSIMGALIALPLATARFYQHGQVEKMVHAYDSAAYEKMAYTRIENDDTADFLLTDLRPPKFRDTLTPMVVFGKMLRISFSEKRCPKEQFPISLNYHYLNPAFDFSRTMHVTLSEKNASYFTLYFPVFLLQNVDGSIEGPEKLTVPLDKAHCVAGIDVITSNDFYPLWLTIQLPSDWQQKPLHQTLKSS